MNPHRSSIANDCSRTSFIHHCYAVCAHAFKQWFNHVVMIDDPYDEAEQKQLTEKLRLEMAFFPDNGYPVTGASQSDTRSSGSQAVKLWIYPRHSRKYESLV